MSSTSETHSFDSDLGYKTELHRVLKQFCCLGEGAVCFVAYYCSCIPLGSITLHSIALHSILFHYIILRCIALHCILKQLAGRGEQCFVAY